MNIAAEEQENRLSVFVWIRLALWVYERTLQTCPPSPLSSPSLALHPSPSTPAHSCSRAICWSRWCVAFRSPARSGLCCRPRAMPRPGACRAGYSLWVVRSPNVFFLPLPADVPRDQKRWLGCHSFNGPYGDCRHSPPGAFCILTGLVTTFSYLIVGFGISVTVLSTSAV